MRSALALDEDLRDETRVRRFGVRHFHRDAVAPIDEIFRDVVGVKLLPFFAGCDGAAVDEEFIFVVGRDEHFALLGECASRTSCENNMSRRESRRSAQETKSIAVHRRTFTAEQISRTAQHIS